MSPSEMIQELLDGELDPHNESALFGELAVNVDLRTEFKQQLAIRHSVQNDRMALIPPAHLTNAVFSNLGFAAPLAGAATGVAGGGLLLQWLSRFGLPLMSAAAAVGITTAAMSTLESSPDAAATAGESPTMASTSTTNTPPLEESKVDNSTHQSVESASPEEAAIASLSRDNARLRAQLRDLKESERSLPASDRRASTPQEMAITTETPRVIDQAATEVPAQVPVMTTLARVETTSIISTRDDLAPFEVQKMDIAPQPWEQFPSFIVQVRGVAAQGLTEVSVQPQTTWYDDASVALLYQLSDRHTFGLEVGNESFPQVFEGMRNGRVIRYEQQPTAQWAGLVYRYSLPAIADRFVPFVQGFAGGSTFGPLGRVAGGIQYSPAGPLTFLVGLEGSLLGYQFQNTWFTSSKLGFTYGVAVRL